ncbi:hypothetical protein RHMOL_Rhmol10G0213300 [Rhododendron molle]|uniref:Uncharacterized protein n=1 Tax=Rhododendron molle TaxID=49168 RepID=A0ACC0M4E9_RHOML|nr:hypothetical protein RHMOL_Rhmol10G0213300 [Rhododendron molle]
MPGLWGKRHLAILMAGADRSSEGGCNSVWLRFSLYNHWRYCWVTSGPDLTTNVCPRVWSCVPIVVGLQCWSLLLIWWVLGGFSGSGQWGSGGALVVGVGVLLESSTGGGGCYWPGVTMGMPGLWAKRHLAILMAGVDRSSEGGCNSVWLRFSLYSRWRYCWTLLMGMPGLRAKRHLAILMAGVDRSSKGGCNSVWLRFSLYNHWRYCWKYFVDEESKKNCFMLFARELTIIYGENEAYWKWEQPSGEDIEVAKLVAVSWLDIKGYIRTINLSPGTLYEIVFEVKKYDQSNSNFDLVIKPQHSKALTRTESLEGKPLEEWFELVVGEFRMSPDYVGNMEFGVEQHDGGWKSGLVVKCAIIRPKK